MSAGRLTRRQAAIIGAYTGVACGPWGDIADYARSLLGHDLFRGLIGKEFRTHNEQKTLEAMQVMVAERARPDFMALCYDPSVVVGETRDISLN